MERKPELEQNRKLIRRRRAKLMRSLRSPHREAAIPDDAGLAEWGTNLPAGDEGLVDLAAGKAVRWVAGRGWAAMEP